MSHPINWAHGDVAVCPRDFRERCENPFPVLTNEEGESWTPDNLMRVSKRSRRKEMFLDDGDRVAFQKLSQVCKAA